MKLYVVFGGAGQWEDRHEWMVAGYTDKVAAEEHVRLSKEYMDAAPSWSWDDGGTNRDEYLKKNPYDNFIDDGCQGAHYHIQELEVFAKVDEFMEKNPK